MVNMNYTADELYKLHRNVIKWIEEMILRNQILLSDIPADIRRSSDMIYVMAFRASRKGTCHRFVSDLQILCEDIILLYDTNDVRKAQLIELLSDTLRLSDYKGDERFEAFKKNMDENLLQELHNYEYAHRKQLQTMLREYRLKNGAETAEKD